MATCFKCKGEYRSADPDDVEGDGFCNGCQRVVDEIALKVDIEMAKRRAINPLPTSPFADLIKENRPINIKELGIRPHG